MSLYSHNGKLPQTLPHRIRLADGSTRTDSSTFTGAEIANAGWTLAPDKPAWDPATQNPPVWTGSAWTVPDKSQHELDAIARENSRAQMSDSFLGLPDWIVGPYFERFESAEAMLNLGLDNAAREMINCLAPMPSFTADQIATFTAVKSQFAASIAALPPS